MPKKKQFSRRFAPRRARRPAGEVGIFDATNSTNERRKWIEAKCHAQGVAVVFIESICELPHVLEENYRNKVKHSPARGRPSQPSHGPGLQSCGWARPAGGGGGLLETDGWCGPAPRLCRNGFRHGHGGFEAAHRELRAAVRDHHRQPAASFLVSKKKKHTGRQEEADAMESCTYFKLHNLHPPSSSAAFHSTRFPHVYVAVEKRCR